MPPTPEQLAAVEALREQILDTARTCGALSEGALLTDFVVIFAQQSYDDDGDGYTPIGLLLSDGQMPDYRLIGLLHLGIALTSGRAVAGYHFRDDTPG